MTENIHKILRNIKARPGMYVGRRSILSLKSFLDGYYYSIQIHALENNDHELWESFQLWLSERYENKTQQDWSKIMLFFYNDEFEALDNFFDLYEAFMRE